MFNIAELITFFGWCSVINFALLLFSSLILFALQEPIASVHSNLTGITTDKLRATYFNYLGHYKILIIVFNLVPYVTLKIMS